MITREKALESEGYKRIPPAVLNSLYNYIQHHQCPGHFVQAVLSNDLDGAFRYADRDSLAAMHDIVQFVHHELPGNAHGSPEAVASWLLTADTPRALF